MPIIEFECANCGTVLEKILSNKEAEDKELKLKPCLNCGNSCMERIMSLPAPAWNDPETG